MYYYGINNLLSAKSFFKSMGGVLVAVAILLVMVTIHEFGHYIAGKILGFRINEFSVGFGPAVFKKRSKKTGELFALRIVPLGGYCAFDGEDAVDEPDKEEPFEEMAEVPEEKPEPEYPEPKGGKFTDMAPWKRIIVLVAGATMNYLLGLFLIMVMFFSCGQVVYKVMKDFPTPPESGTPVTDFEDGDLILQINGKNLYLITDYIDELNGTKAGETVTYTVLREIDGKQQKIDLEWTATENVRFQNMSDTNTLLNKMGIYGLNYTTMKHGVFKTVGMSFEYSGKLAVTILRSIGELFTGKTKITSMGGPVTTIKMTSEAVSMGWINFLNISALIGVNLAVFNLLPIPALDGSKVIFCIIEWIRKKPVNRKVETMIHFIGIILLFGFAILVDVLQFVL